MTCSILWTVIGVLWILGGWSTYVGQVATGLMRPGLGTQIITLVVWPLATIYAMVRH